jgi:hypothetical protein
VTELQDRDYGAEMRALIEAETGTQPYVSALVAIRIVERLEHEDPMLLLGWLRGNAVQILRHTINLRDSARRASARHYSARTVFRDAADTYRETGNKEVVTKFLDARYATDGGLRKRLADMTGKDLAFVADTYADRVKRNRKQEMFLRLLAKKVGGGCVNDYFTEDLLNDMWQSLV